jgi:hypothetical protein
MPRLTDDLMWSGEALPFVTRRLASLRLVPGAGNLEAARIGAERIAWKVGELLRVWDGILPEVEEMMGEERILVMEALEVVTRKGWIVVRGWDLELRINMLFWEDRMMVKTVELDFKSWYYLRVLVSAGKKCKVPV